MPVKHDLDLFKYATRRITDMGSYDFGHKA